MKKPMKHTKVETWGVLNQWGELRVVSGFTRAHAMRQGIWFGPATLDYKDNLQDVGSWDPLNAWERRAWRRVKKECGYELVRVVHSVKGRA